MLSNKAEQGLAGTIKQHLNTVVSQGHMLQNKVVAHDYRQAEETVVTICERRLSHNHNPQI